MNKLVQVTTVDMTWVFFSGLGAVWRRHGLDATAISSPGPLLDRFGRDEQVKTVPMTFSRTINPAADVVNLASLTRLIRHISPDIVHGHTPKGGLLSMIAARIAEVPIRLYHLHGLAYATSAGPRRLILRTTERIACRLADHVYAVSHSVRRQAVADGLVSDAKITTLCSGTMNGVDAQVRFNPGSVSRLRTDELRHQLGIPDARPVIGFIGRLVKDKGVADLAQALQELERSGRDWHAVFVGPLETRDALAPQVVTWLRQHPRVHLTERFDTDLARWYALMDIVVLPSYREGFPTVPLEAAAMGRPVVSTTVPGCTDAVLDDETGRLIPAGAPRSLAAAIARYLDDPELARRHGLRGRERALREFAPESLQEAMMREYIFRLERRGLR